MSIDKVEVTNLQGNLLAFTLDDISNGYVVEDVEGLGPVRATLVSSGFANLPGQQYQSSNRGTRNIVIKLGYAPNFGINETVRVLRTRLYDFFMPEEEVFLTFYMQDGLVVKTSGRVETCEPAIFTSEPRMDISILCFDPDLIEAEPVEIHDTFTTSDATFKDIYVAGNLKVGLTSLRFTVPANTDEFTIYHTTPSGKLRTMLISASLLLGDVIDICTIPGQKSITLTRGNTTSSLLWAVSPQSQWVLLEKGVNRFYLRVDVLESNPVLIEFTNRYGGL